MLVTMLFEDNPRVSDLPKPLKIVAQLITFNTKKFYRPSRVHNPLKN